MRIMLDTNILISAAVLQSQHILKLVDALSEHHTIVLATYVIDELKTVTKRKFPTKYNLIETFLRELPFELVYTPETIEREKYPDIRDLKDLPILVTAIHEDVDVLLSGDGHFAPVDMTHPEILTPREFVTQYC